MIPLRRKHDPHALAVGMAGTRLGDRFVQIGCADGGRLAAIAATVGLSGRAVVVVNDAAAATRAEKGARAQGVHLEIETGTPEATGLDGDAADLVLIDDTAGAFTAMTDDARTAALREALRLLRPGGRAMVVGTTGQSGWTAFISRASRTISVDARPLFEAAGFRATRVLGEREGLIFVEGAKARA
ncbi:MAG: class I SAM-dependent methyltransferase [Acidobacteriaceae bacterium]|jgi:SAM-dependent methyltransferase|nr:class I SAM-dependent methyltransferase [Acidobacteriaceae bacterium]